MSTAPRQGQLAAASAEDLYRLASVYFDHRKAHDFERDFAELGRRELPQMIRRQQIEHIGRRQMELPTHDERRRLVQELEAGSGEVESGRRERAFGR